MSMSGNKTGTGTNNDDIVIAMNDVSNFDTFMLMSTAGAMDVWVSLDGSHYVGPVSLADFGAVTSDPVIVTAANRLYGFRGKFRSIRVMQNGAAAVVGASFTYGEMGN